jgi:hypothetical protein
VLLGVCLVLAACWALTGAGLALWVFRVWMEPAPVFNPNDGPIAADSILDLWLGAVLMAPPLAGWLVAVACLASGYLKRVQATGRTRTAWTGAVIAAVCVDITFLGTFAVLAPVFGMRIGQANWGLVVLSAIFVMTGVAMMAVITVAARGAKRRLPGQLT